MYPNPMHRGDLKRPADDGLAGPMAKRGSTGLSSESVMRLLLPAHKASQTCRLIRSSSWSICSSEQVSWQVEDVLGRGGSNIKKISADTNARIVVMDSIPGCDERVAIITSKEDPAQELSGAQVTKVCSSPPARGRTQQLALLSAERARPGPDEGHRGRATRCGDRHLCLPHPLLQHAGRQRHRQVSSASFIDLQLSAVLRASPRALAGRARS